MTEVTVGMRPFVFDSHARRHLWEWYDFGGAPNDWTDEDVVDFAMWMQSNGEQFHWMADWPSMAATFDSERGYVNQQQGATNVT